MVKTGRKCPNPVGNVINPDDIVRDYGADALRLYEMFIGDFEKSAPWSQASIKGCKRFLERVAGLSDIMVEGEDLSNNVHKLIKKVTEDIDGMKFNTAIAAMMSYLNEVFEAGSINRASLENLLRLLCPFAPHLCEELWESLGHSELLSLSAWPTWNEAKTVDDVVEIALQINGKLRGTLAIAAKAGKEEAIAVARADERIATLIAGKTVVKEIFVPGKIVNLVVK